MRKPEIDDPSANPDAQTKEYGLEKLFFIKAVASIANLQHHHPDFSAAYDYCQVNFTTHTIDGLSENDFISAASVNVLAES